MKDFNLQRWNADQRSKSGRTKRILPDVSPEAEARREAARKASEQEEWLREEMAQSRSAAITRVAEMIHPVHTRLERSTISDKPLGATSGLDHTSFYQSQGQSRSFWKKKKRDTLFDLCQKIPYSEKRR